MNLEDERIGQLLVIKRADDKMVGDRIRPFWTVRCNCGYIYSTSQSYLSRGKRLANNLMCQNCSRVQNARTNSTYNYVARKDGRVWSKDRRMYLTQYNTRGYKTVHLFEGSKYVHVLVAQTHIPNPDNKPQVNHMDGNKTNNHISNLEWVTQSENILHAYANGLNHISEYQSQRIIETNIQRGIDFRKEKYG